jgi:hypothetical protein
VDFVGICFGFIRAVSLYSVLSFRRIYEKFWDKLINIVMLNSEMQNCKNLKVYQEAFSLSVDICKDIRKKTATSDSRTSCLEQLLLSLLIYAKSAAWIMLIK